MDAEHLGTPAITSSPDRDFAYHGAQFLLSVHGTAAGLYLPHVLYRHGLANIAQIALPVDADPYASEAEAWRHAEQQAVRWVHDRTGDGQGRF